MNYWLELSIEYANQRSYLDDLFRVYPTIPEGIREIDKSVWHNVSQAFEAEDNTALIKELLKFKLFPIKDSYVAYLRRDKGALLRNPATVQRLCGRLYEMRIDKIYDRVSEPKETNRQIGPMFKRWVKRALKPHLVDLRTLKATSGNAILEASDEEAGQFARENLGYTIDKGLDFVARFIGNYVIGEAKFLTDFGGHQNAQFEDAVRLFSEPNLKAIPISILDGVPYISSRNKLHKRIISTYKDCNIMSALVLREFLHQV